MTSNHMRHVRADEPSCVHDTVQTRSVCFAFRRTCSPVLHWRFAVLQSQVVCSFEPVEVHLLLAHTNLNWALSSCVLHGAVTCVSHSGSSSELQARGRSVAAASHLVHFGVRMARKRVKAEPRAAEPDSSDDEGPPAGERDGVASPPSRSLQSAKRQRPKYATY